MERPVNANQAGTLTGWDHPATARYYEAFCRSHSRYADASRDLVAQAQLFPGARVLDLAAGSGRTLEEILPHLDASGRVLCVEPAAAMRALGMARVVDARVTWVERLPELPAEFDRILCSAALWQMLPLAATFAALATRLRPGGLLCFNIPAQYLGEADAPGGGADPWLSDLMAHLAAGRASHAAPGDPLPDAAGIDALLHEMGFQAVERSSRRRPLTQTAWRDWLKIPVLTEALLGDLDADARAALIDAAYQAVDGQSWRWERWMLWTARR